MQQHASPSIPSELFSFDEYIQSLGKTRVTGYRWRKRGMIETINIFGRLYVTRDAIAAFERKAKSGDFAIESKTPDRTQVTQAAERRIV